MKIVLHKLLVSMVIIALSIIDSPDANASVAQIPIDPFVTSVTSEQVTISWKKPELASSFDIQYIQDYTEWQDYALNIPANQDFITITGLDSSSIYEFRIRANYEGFSSSEYVRVPIQLHPFKDIDSSRFHYCALDEIGDVYCWGLNQVGQLGRNNDLFPKTVSKVEGVVNATQISVGDDFSCALISTGEIKCWGANDRGQLGKGDIDTVYKSNPVSTVKNIKNAVQIDAGFSSVCALTADEKVFCWGSNWNLQLGQPKATTASGSPLELKQLEDATSISIGEMGCAVLTDKSLKCWGGSNGDYGYLGNPDFMETSSPVPVKNLDNVSSVHVGEGSCAIKLNESLWCWGPGRHGMLGDGTESTAYTAKEIFPAKRFLDVSEAVGEHRCGVLVDKTIQCWGYNNKGQLGNASASEYSLEPLKVQNVIGAKKVVTGHQTSAALQENGKIITWGRGEKGELGRTFSNENQRLPAEIEREYLYEVSLLSSPVVTQITSEKTTTNQIKLNWEAPGTNLEIDKFQIKVSRNGNTWREFESTTNSYNLSNLEPASSYLIKIAIHTEAGWGQESEIFNFFTKGAKSLNLTLTDYEGNPLSGGEVSWMLKNKKFKSAISLGATSNGEITFPKVVAGKATISATKLRTVDGLYVSGKWEVTFGTGPLYLSTPNDEVSRTFSVKVKVPTGQPVIGADVTIDGLSKTLSVEDFTFESVSEISGKSDEYGIFVGTGFVVSNPVAQVFYNDGLLYQYADAEIQSDLTEVTLEEVIWFEASITEDEVNFNQLVEISINVNNQAPLSIHTSTLTNNDSFVSVIPPAGAKQKCKGVKLKSKVQADGKTTLKVCATKSGLYRLKGKGIVSTSFVNLKVIGTPPTKVQNLNAVSIKAGSVKISWKSPVYSGRTKVTKYKITLQSGKTKITRFTNRRTLTIDNLKSAKNYAITIQAVNKYGLGEMSMSVLGVA